jgi:hypothetical protein
MKVLELSSHRLKLQHFPWSSWLGGGMAVLFGVASFIYVLGFRAASASLRCQRPIAIPIVSCELSHFTLLGIARSRKLYDLQEASVLQTYRSRGGPRYAVELRTGLSRAVLLKEPNARQYAIEQDVDRINQFIYNTGETSLILRQDGRLSAVFMGIFALISGGMGVWLLSTPITTCAFYKRLNKVILETQRWYGTTEAIEYSLHKISTVEIEEKRTKNGKIYRTILVINYAERIPLTHDFTCEKNARETCYTIQKFLHKTY